MGKSQTTRIQGGQTKPNETSTRLMLSSSNTEAALRIAKAKQRALKFRRELLRMKGAVPAPLSCSIDEGRMGAGSSGGSLGEELLPNYCLLKIT